MSTAPTNLILTADGVELVIGVPIPVQTGMAVGPAGGDLDGSYPDPDVVAFHESGGPTRLAVSSISDNQALIRSGGTIVGYSVPILLSGSGSPVGLTTGVLGQTYHDLVSKIFYKCISSPSGTSWVTI